MPHVNALRLSDIHAGDDAFAPAVPALLRSDSRCSDALVGVRPSGTIRRHSSFVGAQAGLFREAGAHGSALDAASAAMPLSSKRLRAANAEQWFTRVHPTAFGSGHGSHHGEELDHDAAVEHAWDHAVGGFKTCLLALVASTAAWINAYVTYNCEKEHYEHELHEIEEIRRGGGNSPRRAH